MRVLRRLVLGPLLVMSSLTVIAVQRIQTGIGPCNGCPDQQNPTNTAIITPSVACASSPGILIAC